MPNEIRGPKDLKSCVPTDLLAGATEVPLQIVVLPVYFFHQSWSYSKVAYTNRSHAYRALYRSHSSIAPDSYPT